MSYRIQRRRDCPWQTTPPAIYVGRPSRFGNPFRVGIDGTARECVQFYEAHYVDDVAYRATVRRLLAGKVLACWCKLDQPCHGDVLLNWANACFHPGAPGLWQETTAHYDYADACTKCPVCGGVGWGWRGWFTCDDRDGCHAIAEIASGRTFLPVGREDTP